MTIPIERIETLLWHFLNVGEYETRQQVTQVRDLKISVYTDHDPPHFHVFSVQKNIEATFSLDTLELLTSQPRMISAQDIKTIQETFRNNTDLYESLKLKHAERNPKN